MDGRDHDGNHYRQTAMFQRKDGINWNNDETGLGDAITFAVLRAVWTQNKRFTDADINAMPPCQRERKCNSVLKEELHLGLLFSLLLLFLPAAATG